MRQFNRRISSLNVYRVEIYFVTKLKDWNSCYSTLGH